MKFYVLFLLVLVAGPAFPNGQLKTVLRCQSMSKQKLHSLQVFKNKAGEFSISDSSLGYMAVTYTSPQKFEGPAVFENEHLLLQYKLSAVADAKGYRPGFLSFSFNRSPVWLKCK